MSMVYEIPLSPQPQSFNISLAGKSYRAVMKWNWCAGCWMLDLYDSDGNEVLLGLAIVTGVDLLEQFEYLEFGGQLVAQTDHDTFAVPTYANLGNAGHLYFIVP